MPQRERLQSAVTSPFGNQAGSLHEPVPGQESMNREPASTMDMSMPGMPAESPAISRGQVPEIETSESELEAGADPNAVNDPFADTASAEAWLAGLASEGGVPAEPRGNESPEDARVSNDMNFMQRYLAENWPNLRKSFTRSPNELMQVAQESGQFEDVWIAESSQVMVKRPGSEPEEFDRALIGAADIMKMGIEFGIRAKSAALGGAAGGAAGTAVAPIAGTAAGTAAGAIAGWTGAGVPAALLSENIADLIAKNVFGIEHGEDRNFGREQATTAALAVGFGALGSGLARVGRAGVNKVRDTVSNYRDAVREITEEIVEDDRIVSQVLRQNGITASSDGVVTLRSGPSMLASDVPEVRVMLGDMTRHPEMRQFLNQDAANREEAFRVLTRGVRLIGGDKGNLGSDMVLDMRMIRQAEGQALGGMRSHLTQEAAGVPQLMPQTTTQFQMLSDVIPDSSPQNTGRAIKEMVVNYGMKPSEARALLQQHAKFSRALNKGQGTMSIDDALELYTELGRPGGFIERGMRAPGGSSSRAVAESLSDLRHALRDDVADSMGNVLGQDAAEIYGSGMTRYREIMDATRKLTRSMTDSNISSQNFMNGLTKGPKAYSNFKAVQTIVRESNPEQYDQLVSSYFDSLINNNTTALGRVGGKSMRNGIPEVDFNKLTNEWLKIDPRIQTELLENVGLTPKHFNAFLRGALRRQSSTIEGMSDELKVQIARNISVLSVGSGLAKKAQAVRFATRMLESVGDYSGINTSGATRNNMMKWISMDGGVERIIEATPGMKPSQASRLRNWAASYQESEVWKYGTEAAKRSTTVGLRRRGSEMQSDVQPTEPQTPELRRRGR